MEGKNKKKKKKQAVQLKSKLQNTETGRNMTAT
jgi:hypothetical protein